MEPAPSIVAGTTVGGHVASTRIASSCVGTDAPHACAAKMFRTAGMTSFFAMQRRSWTSLRYTVG